MATSNPTHAGGEFMVQDLDHMVIDNSSNQSAKRKGIQQSEQAQSANRQQGADHGHKPRRQAQCEPVYNKR